MREKLIDCLVIGAGPAGLTAATYLARFMRDVLVLHGGASRASLMPLSHNAPGYPDGISGPALLRALEQQALKFGAGIVRSRVLALTRNGNHFEAAHEHGTVRARRVILATGIIDHVLPLEDIPGALQSGQLGYCPVCDAYEGRDKRICVIGPAKSAIAKAMFLRTYSTDVTVICPEVEPGEDDAGNGRIRIVTGRVTAVLRRDRMAVVLDRSDTYEFDLVYPALGCSPQSTFATNLGAEADADGALLVDKHQQTSVPGLYAAGDVASQLDQIAVAFGHAAIAATHIHNDLPKNLRE
jgi:thioredoxin reductase (NADPH)